MECCGCFKPKPKRSTNFPQPPGGGGGGGPHPIIQMDGSERVQNMIMRQMSSLEQKKDVMIVHGGAGTPEGHEVRNGAPPSSGGQVVDIMLNNNKPQATHSVIAQDEGGKTKRHITLTQDKRSSSSQVLLNNSSSLTKLQYHQQQQLDRLKLKKQSNADIKITINNQSKAKNEAELKEQVVDYLLGMVSEEEGKVSQSQQILKEQSGVLSATRNRFIADINNQGNNIAYSSVGFKQSLREGGSTYISDLMIQRGSKLPLYSYKVYKYLCAGCMKFFHKLLIIEESLGDLFYSPPSNQNNNKSGNNTNKFNSSDQLPNVPSPPKPIEMTRKIHDLYKGALESQSHEHHTYCPYCSESVYLLLSSSLLLGSEQMHRNNVQYMGEEYSCCCMQERAQKMCAENIVSSQSMATQSQQQMMVGAAGGINQPTSLPSQQNLPHLQQQHVYNKAYSIVSDSTPKMPSSGINPEQHNQFLLGTTNLHATLEVNVSDQNISQSNLLMGQKYTTSEMLHQVQSLENIGNIKQFDQNGATSTLKSQSQVIGGGGHSQKQLVQPLSLVNAKQLLGMHVLRTVQEKLVDVRQQVRTAHVLYLGDPASSTSNSKHLHQQQTLASQNNEQTIGMKTAATTATLGSKHSQAFHASSKDCCNVQHYNPPEMDPYYKPEREQCEVYNKNLMRHMIDQKMKKNKSFMELKVIPLTQQQPSQQQQQQQPQAVTPFQIKLQQNNKLLQPDSILNQQDLLRHQQFLHQSSGALGVREGNILFQKLHPKIERQQKQNNSPQQQQQQLKQ